jgi:hypothetical protein
LSQLPAASLWPAAQQNLAEKPIALDVCRPINAGALHGIFSENEAPG